MIKCESRRYQHENGGRKNLLHLENQPTYGLISRRSGNMLPYQKSVTVVITFQEQAILPEISDSGDNPPGTCYLTRNQ